MWTFQKWGFEFIFMRKYAEKKIVKTIVFNNLFNLQLRNSRCYQKKTKMCLKLLQLINIITFIDLKISIPKYNNKSQFIIIT